MSDVKRTIHIQMDNHDVPVDIGQENEDLIRKLFDFANSDDTEVNDKEEKEKCEQSGKSFTGKDAAGKERGPLTRDQKNVLIGFDTACISIRMFMANLDIYRDKIHNALISYSYDAKDFGTANKLIDMLLSRDALSELASGDEDDCERYGTAFAVYKELCDAMMDSMNTDRNHIVTSFIEGNLGY